MANAWNKSDLHVNYKYDLVMQEDAGGNAEIVRTGNGSPAHTLAQSLYVCIQSGLGDFALRSVFGASPRGFHGAPMTRTLIEELKAYVSNLIARSGVNADRFPITVKAAPISRRDIAMEVKVMHPRDPNTPLVLIRMMYNTRDNSVKPLYNGYGG